MKAFLILSVFLLPLMIARPVHADPCPGFTAAIDEVEAALDAVHAKAQTPPPAPAPSATH